LSVAGGSARGGAGGGGRRDRQVGRRVEKAAFRKVYYVAKRAGRVRGRGWVRVLWVMEVRCMDAWMLAREASKRVCYSQRCGESASATSALGHGGGCCCGWMAERQTWQRGRHVECVRVSVRVHVERVVLQGSHSQGAARVLRRVARRPRPGSQPPHGTFPRCTTTPIYRRQECIETWRRHLISCPLLRRRHAARTSRPLSVLQAARAWLPYWVPGL
jgi:hypothetical protein